MLELFKSKKNKSNQGSSGMLDLISEAKSQTKDRDEKRVNQSDLLYNEALELIEEFKQTKKNSTLEEASIKLEESLKYSRSKGETYFWLSYIFYIYGKDKEAFEYLRVAESLSPEYSQIKKFKTIISETQRG